jgi:hypothetical protein
MIPGSRTLRFLGALLLAACGTAVAQGGAAVITLVMPPPGGDGYSALQTGGAHPSGAAGLYYNPALLSELAPATGSQLHFTHSRQDLLPDLGLDDLDQSFTGFAFALPDAKGGFDMGIGFFRNHVDFGEDLTFDAEDTSAIRAQETVYGLGLAARLGLPVSIGGTVKFYDSDLSPGGRASGFAFDIGALTLHRFEPLAFQDFRSLEVTPSYGISLLNLGGDVAYGDAEATDPLPRTLRRSLGAEARFADVVSASWGFDWEHEVHRRARLDDPAVRTRGHVVSVLGFHYGRMKLDDPVGRRREIHKSRSFEFSMLEAYRVWRRVKTGDFTSASAALDAGFPFAATTFLGVPFRANPRLVIGSRRIESRDGGIRDSQEATYWSLSL